jgi:hypothetical protein
LNPRNQQPTTKSKAKSLKIKILQQILNHQKKTLAEAPKSLKLHLNLQAKMCLVLLPESLKNTSFNATQHTAIIFTYSYFAKTASPPLTMVNAIAKNVIIIGNTAHVSAKFVKSI